MLRVRMNLRRALGRIPANRGGPVRAGAGNRGTFEDFLAKLLAVESGIDPARFETYVREYESAIVPYPRVTSPGRVIRDRRTGGYQFEPMTVAAYFRTLGVDRLFDPSSPACIRAMQYASTNVLGFIGYQFGEAALIATGYYRAETVRYRRRGGRFREYESYYVGALHDKTWRGGRTEVLHRLPSTGAHMVATDVNRWRGTFTGKHGISDLEDFKDPLHQEFVIRDLIASNHAVLQRTLSRNGYDVRASRASWSGLLAAAHLCGPYATARFLLDGAITKDEFKTDIRFYVNAFEGYTTPYCA